MQRTSPNKEEWKRYKEVSISWAKYDAHRLSECKRVLDLKELFIDLDKPVQRREFKLSGLMVLLMFKILFGISYRTIASAAKDLGIYGALSMKRAPCYKTLQNTMGYLNEDFLIRINQCLTPSVISLAGVDSSGLKTRNKGVWVQIRFRRYGKKQDFKKVHIFVDLHSKKILFCILTNGASSDAPQLKHILRQCNWIRVDIILGDGGYDTRECFNEITRYNSITGITVRKNATRKAHDSPSRRKAVIEQQKNLDIWKEKVRYRMRCIVEAIFSGTKRRFGEYLFSIIDRYRSIEIWLRTILWNVLIYPR
jgi:hypothetical protein